MLCDAVVMAVVNKYWLIQGKENGQSKAPRLNFPPWEQEKPSKRKKEGHETLKIILKSCFTQTDAHLGSIIRLKRKNGCNFSRPN